MDSIDKFISPNMLSLTDSYAVKILICFFLKQIERPVTPNQLMEIATADGIINYFYYTEAIESLLEAETIKLEEIEGTEYYMLSDIGKKGADSFKTLVPKSFRDKILASGMRLFSKLKIEHDVVCEIEKLDKGYKVCCTFKDNDVVLLGMSLFAPDIDQARLMKEKILLNPSEFYSKVIDYTLDNREYIPDIT